MAAKKKASKSRMKMKPIEAWAAVKKERPNIYLHELYAARIPHSLDKDYRWQKVRIVPVEE